MQCRRDHMDHQHDVDYLPVQSRHTTAINMASFDRVTGSAGTWQCSGRCVLAVLVLT